MKIITSTDLKHWADTLESKSMFPLLIRKLILATINIENINKIEFPFGDDVQVGGYDGDLETKEKNIYIPQGSSVWEFGITEQKKKKADEDYEKRTNNPLGKVQSETTYISATLKKYTKKQVWADGKNDEGIWADVRYYDALDIEHWLDLAPSVEIWLAERLGKPVSGIQCADEYWKHWTTKEGLHFPCKLLTESRPQQYESLKKLFSKQGGKLQYIKSNTSEESLAFILATIQGLEGVLRDSLYSKTLVVSNQDSFRVLLQNKESLIFITKFIVDEVDINKAIARGHKVIIPVSNSYSSKQDTIIDLPIISSDVFIRSLEKMGIDPEQSRLLSINTGRDISVLRRSLDFSTKMPVWIEEGNIENFIPFLFISRYDANIDGDKEIIEKITNTKFGKYQKYLTQILHKEGTPLYNIGSKWRLISHADSWVYLSRFVTSEDLNKFKEIAILILSEINPKYNLDPEKRYMSAFYNAHSKYSYYLKKGICESLIVLSVLAKNYDFPALSNPKQFVDNIVRQILKLADSNTLISLGNNLTLLAESSPDVFISELEIAIKDKRIMGFFEEEKDLMSTSNELPNLLWALEGIAWMPEHLTNVVRILCNLIELQPKKLPTSNTPLNTLISIFKTWYPQTNADSSERQQVLNILKKENPNIAFKLFSTLLHGGSDHAFPNHKMRWRLFSETRKVSVTHLEIFEMHDYIIKSLIELTTSDIDVLKYLVLIDKLDDINRSKIDDVLLIFDDIEKFNSSDKAKIYHAFRKIIGRHRTYSTAKWALPETHLLKMETTAKKFEPTDTILSQSFLFEEHHPEFFKGGDSTMRDYEKKEKELTLLRDCFISKVISEKGIKAILEVANKSENPYLYGKSLANIELNKEQKTLLYTLLKSSDGNDKQLLSQYFYSIETLKNRKEVIAVFEDICRNDSYKSEHKTQILFALNPDIELFEYIDSIGDEEIKRIYWSILNLYVPRGEKAIIFAIKKLKEYKRPIAVLNTLGRAKITTILSSEFIIDTLESLDLSVVDEPENIRIDLHYMKEIFNDLHQLNNIDIDRMSKIEYKFLFVFDRYGHGVKPKYLYRAITKEPTIYIDLIKNLFKPDDEDWKEEQVIETNPALKKQIVENAYSILSNFNLIPGLNEKGCIIEEELNTWIDKVRKLAIENRRIKVTDRKIGELLARYPSQNDNLSFPIEIIDVLERINSESMYSNFSMQITNRLGFTSRPSGSGGYIERNRAKHFNTLADGIKITHPNVASIYRNIADRYEIDGKEMDDSELRNSLG